MTKYVVPFLQQHKWIALVSVFVLSLYAVSKSKDQTKVLILNPDAPVENKRILSSGQEHVVQGQEKLLSKKAEQLMASQAQVEDALRTLNEKITSLETKVSTPSQESIQFHQNPNAYRSQVMPNKPRISKPKTGPSIVSFPAPVNQKKVITLPSGSYVKAKLMTGVEAPPGKTYPVLIQLDYAYKIPNYHDLDLSGCFMIAKATGNLNLERVEVQVTKLSCVSPKGNMFERPINGFIADQKDNSFALRGRVSSKQDRKAMAAFMASVVDGVGKALKEAQQTHQTTALGGSQSVLTGSTSKYMLGGGASQAASQVAQWYLSQADQLLPTINVGSGRDVWIVMQDAVDLPKEFFQGVQNEKPRFFSAVLE